MEEIKADLERKLKESNEEVKNLVEKLKKVEANGQISLDEHIFWQT